MSLNLNSLVVDSSGRVSFSGLTSGIDFQAVVDSIIKARSIPVDNLKARISDNSDKISAYQDLRTKLGALKDALSTLYGAVSVDKTTDIFAAKGPVLSTSRSDGGTASPATSLLGVSIANNASIGNHTLEILQTATAHKVGSASQASTTTALGLTGTFTVNGQTITLASTDTLADVRDRINAATSAKVTASIVSVGPSDNVLVLTAQDLGTDIKLADTSGTPLQTLGILDSGGNIVNELQAARQSQFYADSLRDSSVAHYRSSAQDASTSPVTANGAGTAGTLQFFDSSNTAIGTVAYAAGDDLDTVAANINADTALQAAGIRAQVVHDTDGYHLDISGTAAFKLTDTGSSMADLGLDYRQMSDLESGGSATVSASGTLSFNEIGGAGLGSVSYTAGETLSQLAADITANVTNVSASVVQDGSGSRLEITGQNGVAYTMSDTSTLVSDLGFHDKRLLVERDSNTVSDLFTGVTLNLFAAEKGTTVNLGVEQDLGKIEDKISAFVDAYNSVKQFINEQTYVDPTTGKPGQNATLYDSPAIKNIEQRLSQVFGIGAEGDNISAHVLAEIGIKFVDNNTISDPTQADTLTLDKTTLESKLLNDPDAVRDLFTFHFTSSDPRVVLLGFDGNTSFKSGGYTLNLNYDSVNGNVSSANIDGASSGADDGSMTVGGSGTKVVASDQTGANGLSLLYTGDQSLSGVHLDVSVGIGAQMFYALDNMLDTNSGAVDSEINTLKDQNDQTQTRVDQMLTRLENERQRRLQEYQNLETRLAQMNQVLDQIKQTTNAMFGTKN